MRAAAVSNAGRGRSAAAAYLPAAGLRRVVQDASNDYGRKHLARALWRSMAGAVPVELLEQGWSAVQVVRAAAFPVHEVLGEVGAHFDRSIDQVPGERVRSVALRVVERRSRRGERWAIDLLRAAAERSADELEDRARSVRERFRAGGRG